MLRVLKEEHSAHLPDVDGGVERLADVHAEVGAQQVEVPRQRVQLHLSTSSTSETLLLPVRYVQSWMPSPALHMNLSVVAPGNQAGCQG